MREEKERSKRWDRTTNSGTAGSGSDNWATGSSSLTEGHTCILNTFRWHTSYIFLGFFSKTISAADFASFVRPLFWKKKRKKGRQGAEKVLNSQGMGLLAGRLPLYHVDIGGRAKKIILFIPQENKWVRTKK